MKRSTWTSSGSVCSADCVSAAGGAAVGAGEPAAGGPGDALQVPILAAGGVLAQDRLLLLAGHHVTKVEDQPRLPLPAADGHRVHRHPGLLQGRQRLVEGLGKRLLPVGEEHRLEVAAAGLDA